MKKIIPLICGIGGIIIGLVIIAFSIMDKEISKPLWFAFSILCFANAIINFGRMNQKK